ncbi:DUF1579 family protein [Streptomyces flavofungini]|uniref:DUF1579 family protein n=1 Tax=Streptomyces flavofungini TaxID=68200 RepID=UPI0034E054EA
MRELDFLLGSLRCLGRAAGSVLTARARPILGGHFYELDLTHLRPGERQRTRGSWVLGWDRVDARFVSYYFDDVGTRGTSASPGWRGGRLTFTGSYVTGGAERRVTARTRDHPR